jgi:hypothetical protein
MDEMFHDAPRLAVVRPTNEFGRLGAVDDAAGRADRPT